MWRGVEAVAEGSLPYPFHPAEGGLVLWAYDDDNGHYFWRTVGAPDEWTVVVTESLEWWEYPGGFGDFWAGLAEGRIDSPVIMADFSGVGLSVRKFGAGSD